MPFYLNLKIEPCLTVAYGTLFFTPFKYYLKVTENIKKTIQPLIVWENTNETFFSKRRLKGSIVFRVSQCRLLFRFCILEKNLIFRRKTLIGTQTEATSRNQKFVWNKSRCWRHSTVEFDVDFRRWHDSIKSVGT